MARIIFFEERNFQGRSYETSSDCSDIMMHLNRVNSCRVENGCFVGFDRTSFMGNQVFLRRGEISDLQRLSSTIGILGGVMMDTIRSCRMIPMGHRGLFRIKIHERENLSGQMQELMEDCESIRDSLYMPDCQSVDVLEGHWLLFEQPNFRGRMILVRPGERRNVREIANSNIMRISSLRRITDVC